MLLGRRSKHGSLIVRWPRMCHRTDSRIERSRITAYAETKREVGRAKNFDLFSDANGRFGVRLAVSRQLAKASNRSRATFIRIERGSGLGANLAVGWL